jgi:hypothetical protein
MSDWSRTEIAQPVRVEYRVKCIHSTMHGDSADWNQVYGAMSAAISEYTKLMGKAGIEHWEPSDDAIQVSPADDEIVIWFDKPVP